MKAVGGTLAGLEIWELAFIPSILNNAETWVDIDQNSIKILNNLQNMMFRYLLNTPRSTPKPFLLWELGCLSMENRIIKQKLNFFYHLVNLPDTTLAKEMVNVQISYEFPGLARECQKFITSMNLPDITNINLTKLEWKKIVKKAIREKNKKDLLKEIEKLDKVKEYSVENFELKEYFKTLNLNDARNIFKFRSKMTQYVKRNYSHDKRNIDSLWKCDSCKQCIDTQSHMMWCEAYRGIRENLNFNDNKDLALYIGKVLDIREKLDTRK